MRKSPAKLLRRLCQHKNPEQSQSAISAGTSFPAKLEPKLNYAETCCCPKPSTTESHTESSGLFQKQRKGPDADKPDFGAELGLPFLPSLLQHFRVSVLFGFASNLLQTPKWEAERGSCNAGRTGSPHANVSLDPRL